MAFESPANFGILPSDISAAVNSVTGTANQVTASPTTGNVVVSLPSSVSTGQFIATNSITGSVNQAPFDLGTLSFSDTGLVASLQGSTNSYVQCVVQNTNTGAAASSSFVVNNDQGTASTYYGEFGINSSVFSGSGSFNQPNYTYVTSTSGDLAIGTTTSNAIHFVVGNSATDAMFIDTSSRLNTSHQIISTLATGTAPFSVTSTTQVANLNAATCGVATNIASGIANQIPYQTGAGATSFYSASNYGVHVYGATGVPQSIAGAAGVLVGSASAIPSFSTALSGLTTIGASGNATWTQTTAATSGANQNSPSLNLISTYWTGSASANDTFTIQATPASGSNPLVTLAFTHSGSTGGALYSFAAGNFAINGNGKPTKLNAIALSTSGNGVPGEVNYVNVTAQAANYNSGSALTLYTPAASTVLRISFSQSITQAATSSSTFPSLTLGWTDSGGIARTQTLVATSTTNATTVTTNGVAVINTNSSTAVTVTSASYASSGATPMQYNLSIIAEVL